MTRQALAGAVPENERGALQRLQRAARIAQGFFGPSVPRLAVDRLIAEAVRLVPELATEREPTNALERLHASLVLFLECHTADSRDLESRRLDMLLAARRPFANKAATSD